ncbi:MAG TPA: Ig-like domain-containing protein [Dokdonella sp.]|uniref:Ig-like domain-containing protein n=1 Tax=Dokdonella sp. TaxID=2291710 RepID=UPI002D7EAF55|nr:Ig-like domain-containing protein [Dokdonella sp.]HET9031658.1 Ig-like domain-containing protein [Dokdonella sp.]
MIRKLPLCIAFALSATAYAQPASEPVSGDATIPLTYVGSNARVSLGINNDGDVLGEILAILGKTDESAWLGELWFGQGGAGGLQIGYNRLSGNAESDSATVWKFFAAGDQNRFKDRKATLGLGWERNDLFFSTYISHATSGSRLVDARLLSDTTTISGSDEIGDYTQSQTIDTLINAFEHPYENGIGLRFGSYFDQPLLRVRGGFDYEKGKFSSDQSTFSLGVDKLFRNNPFSLSLQGEYARKSGDFEVDKSDTRGWLLVRYDFAKNYRAREPFKLVEVRSPAPAPAPAEARVVRNDVRLDGDAFFRFDHDELNADAIAALDALIGKLASDARVSRVSVVGHTDSVGPEAYNQKLSERRAASAKAYLISRGIPADQIDTRGDGELNPSHPNDTAENRQKNRRVDVEFLTIEETTVPAAEPAAVPDKVEWVREPVKANPAWIERALRNPGEHKRTVDVYRFEESTTTTTLGPREYLNGVPSAADDAITVDFESIANLIDVLANDSDPDNDPLTITAVSSPAHGTAEISAGGISYTPMAGYSGADSFTYTISDGRGGTATASVSVTVNPAAESNRPPIAVNDDDNVLKGYDNDIDVLANDSDPDGDPLTVISVEHTGPGLATITINADNTIHYQSIHGFSGYDSFRYTISDGRGGTSTAAVSVLVFEITPG